MTDIPFIENDEPKPKTIVIETRAWMCPRCSGLISEETIGKPELYPADQWLCSECREMSLFREWTPGIWRATGIPQPEES